MAADTCSCPQCRAILRIPPSLNPEDQVRCTRCHADFVLSERAIPARITANPPPEADTRRITDEPLLPPVREDDYPEGAAIPYQEDDARPGYRGLAGLSSDYTIDLNEWFRHANANWGEILGGTILWLFLFWLIQFLLGYLPCIGWLASFLISPALMAGITIVSLRQLRGQRWSFGAFFSGFKWFGPLFANALFAAVLALACYLVIDLPGRPGPTTLVVSLVGGCWFTYIGLRAFFFSTQLIVDRNCGPIEAIQGSWNLTRGHFWGLLGVALLLGLINLAGLLLFVVGVLFTLPWTALVVNAGYLIITGRGLRSDRDHLWE